MNNRNFILSSGLKTEHNINVLVIKRNDRPIMVTKDTIIEELDTLIVFGPYSKIKEIFL